MSTNETSYQPTGLSRKRLSETSLTSDCSSVNSASSSFKRHNRASSASDQLANATRRGPWSTEEDELLTSLVNKFGTKKWAHIADRIPGRVGKQCRERWLNHLRNDVKKTIWTEEEDRILIRAQQELGNRWSAIAKLLPGRPENSVKNRFNSLSHRLKRWEEIGQIPDANAYPSPQGFISNDTPDSHYPHGRSANEMYEVQPFMIGATNTNIFPPGIPYTQQQPTIQELQSNPALAYKHGVFQPWNILNLPARLNAGTNNDDYSNLTATSHDKKKRPEAWKSPPAAESCASSNASSPDQSPEQQQDAKSAGLMLLATLCT